MSKAQWRNRPPPFPTLILSGDEALAALTAMLKPGAPAPTGEAKRHFNRARIKLEDYLAERVVHSWSALGWMAARNGQAHSPPGDMGSVASTAWFDGYERYRPEMRNPYRQGKGVKVWGDEHQ